LLAQLAQLARDCVEVDEEEERVREGRAGGGPFPDDGLRGDAWGVGVSGADSRLCAAEVEGLGGGADGMVVMTGQSPVAD
jgi:hypothetical protein